MTITKSTKVTHCDFCADFLPLATWCYFWFCLIVGIVCMQDFPILNNIEFSLDLILQVVCQPHFLLDNDVHESLWCCLVAKVRLPTLYPMANLFKLKLEHELEQ